MKMRLGTLLLLVLAGCDARGCFAASDLFAFWRADLIDACCTCLAAQSVPPGVGTCAVAYLQPDGGVAFADAGPPPDAGDAVDADAVPCLCEGDASSCRAALSKGASVTLPGACVADTGTTFAPCSGACRDVLTFDPLSTGP